MNEQPGSKTEGPGEVPFFVCARCGNTYFFYASKIESGVLVVDKSRVICGNCREASPAPSPQSPAGGDVLARQERMAELEREIARLESYEPTFIGKSNLALYRSELSRLRNEQPKGDEPWCEHSNCPPHECDACSPSDLPAREGGSK